MDGDRQQLLDESLWPESVTVGEWFSKPPENVQPAESTHCRSAAAVADAVAAPTSLVIGRPPYAGPESVSVAGALSRVFCVVRRSAV